MATTSQPDSPVPQVLPRGRHAAPPEVVRESQRGRLLQAMAEIVDARGYGRASVAEVIERAGVSRRTFYEHFANKEECFLAAYDSGVELVLGAIDRELSGPIQADPLAATAAGARAYLGTLADNPALARTFLIEVLGAGAAALARRSAVHERFADQIARSYRAAGLPPREQHVFRACIGAINELVADHVLEHGAEGLRELEGTVFGVSAALLFGASAGEAASGG